MAGAFACDSPVGHPFAASETDRPSGIVAAGGYPSAQIDVGGGHIAVEFAPGRVGVSRSVIVNWISASAHAVAAYYGRFPVSQARIVILPVPGDNGISGTTYGYGGALSDVRLGELVTQSQLRDDWVMTHEMVHMAFPQVPEQHAWIEEGISTYVEPIARLEVGQLSREIIWQELVEGIPHGLPGPGDRGLDYTHTWGRTYWGGALFCLLADIEIRERTSNRKGLRDALRSIVDAGGNVTVSWSLPQALRVADQALGVPALTELYAKMRAKPIDVDVEALWQKLGIEDRDGVVMFSDVAPLAQVREAITARPSNFIAWLVGGKPQPIAPRFVAPAKNRGDG